MFVLTRVTALVGMILFAGGVTAAPASAAEANSAGGGVVFVQNDALDGNQVIAYDRDPDG